MDCDRHGPTEGPTEPCAPETDGSVGLSALYTPLPTVLLTAYGAAGSAELTASHLGRSDTTAPTLRTHTGPNMTSTYDDASRRSILRPASATMGTSRAQITRAIARCPQTSAMPSPSTATR